MDAVEQYKITNLFYRNQRLFRDVGATHVGTYPDGTLRGINYKEQEERLLQVFTPHWTWSRCYVMSQFVFYYLGGYESDWELKCIKQIPFNISGVEGLTTHWYVQNSKDDRIIDLTKEQFSGLLNINQWYEQGRRANLGFPHYFVSRQKKLNVDGKTVPSKECLKFYEIWRELEGPHEPLERYYKVFVESLKQKASGYI